MKKYCDETQKKEHSADAQLKFWNYSKSFQLLCDSELEIKGDVKVNFNINQD